MFTCETCKKILGTIQESEEIYVRGEVSLVILCQSCGTANKVILYEYNKERMKKKQK